MNLYGYASGDPINNSDPFGLCDDPPCTLGDRLSIAIRAKAKEIVREVAEFGASLRSGTNEVGNRVVAGAAFEAGIFAADATYTASGSGGARTAIGASSDALSATVFLKLKLQDPVPGGFNADVNWGPGKLGFSTGGGDLRITEIGVDWGFQLGRRAGRPVVGASATIPGTESCVTDACDK